VGEVASNSWRVLIEISGDRCEFSSSQGCSSFFPEVEVGVTTIYDYLSLIQDISRQLQELKKDDVEIVSRLIRALDLKALGYLTLASNTALEIQSVVEGDIPKGCFGFPEFSTQEKK